MQNESAIRLWEAFSKNKPNFPEQFDGIWKLGDSEEYTKWSNRLVLSGLKTVCSYPLEVFLGSSQPVPEAGDHYVLLDSQESAVAIIQLLDVQTRPFEDIPESYACKAGEGDRSLDTWKENHKPYFKRLLDAKGVEFSTKIDILCVEFELVFAA